MVGRELVPRLRFPEFRGTGGWDATTVGAVCEVLPGYGFPEELQGRTSGRYPFCKVSDVSKAVAEAGGALESAANYVDERDVSDLRANPLPIGTTVFAKIGEALRLNRRAITKRECLIDNNVVGLKASADSGDDYFIYLTSQKIDLTEYCGGAVPSVNKSTLEAISLPIPGLREQRKVAACLASLDDLIAAEAKTLDTLKVYKKGLMQQLFPQEGETVPRLRFPEFRGAGEWEESMLGDVAERLLDGTHFSPESKSGPYLYMTSKNIRPGRLDLKNVSYISEEEHREIFKRCPVAKNDLLLTKDGASTGNCALNTLDFEFSLLSSVAVIRGKPLVLRQDFLCQDFMSDHLQEQIIGATSGQAITRITLEKIRLFRVWTPQIPEQSRIASFLSSLDQRIAAQAQKVDALKTHKKGLMQGLFPSMKEESRGDAEFAEVSP